MNVVFNDFYGGIKNYHLSIGYHHPKLNTNFSWGLNYFSYGNVTETDASGNVLGKFKPTDWVMQLSASRSYLEKWNYGGTLKYISSNYGQYRSNGLAIDVGLLFSDSAKLFSASFLAKNMGVQLKKYNGSSRDDLPFDLQAGLTKKLKGAPFSFSLTAQRMHQYNTRYDDTTFNNENGFKYGSSIGKLLDHVILATTIYFGERIEAIVGYNFLRRRELNIGDNANGLNGFSIGASAQLGKFTIRIARAYYQNNSAYNQFGLNLKLNQYFGLGKFGEKIGW